MKLGFCAFILVWIATTATANPIQVRTGEHSNFTRVVVTISEGTAWQFGRSEAGYVLRLPVQDGYQLDNFFDIIPRTRIEDVLQRPDVGELEMIVSCPCTARAYLFRDDILVIDVQDGLPSRINSAELSLRPFVPEPDVPSPSGPMPIVARAPLLPLFPTGPGPRRLNTPAMLPPAANTSARPTLLSRDDQDLVRELEENVTRVLGDALTQGFVTANELGAADETARSIARPTVGFDQLPGIETRTSVDDSTGQSGPVPNETQSGRACLPVSYFDVNAWSDGGPFNAQVGTIRKGLYGEFDVPNEDAILRLAQIYVHFGFGQEALQTLALDQAQTQERRYLGLMAQLIDAKNLPLAGFEGQVSCASNVALWALLAFGDEPLDGQVDRNSVVQTFKGLPLHLQDIIGPRLSKTFARIGDAEAAQQVLDRVGVGTENAAEIAIAESVLAQNQQSTPDILPPLEEVMNTNTRLTPELITRYFDVGVAENYPFDDDVFLLADALRFEAGSSDMIIPLTVSQFHAHLSVGQFNAADEILMRNANGFPSALRQDLERAFARAAVEKMDDGAFGRFIWSGKPIPKDADILGSIAQRLEDMGFSARASDLLGERTIATELAPGQQEETSSIPEQNTTEQNLPSVATQTNLSLGAARDLLTQSMSTRETLEAQRASLR